MQTATATVVSLNPTDSQKQPTKPEKPKCSNLWVRDNNAVQWVELLPLSSNPGLETGGSGPVKVWKLDWKTFKLHLLRDDFSRHVCRTRMLLSVVRTAWKSSPLRLTPFCYLPDDQESPVVLSSASAKFFKADFTQTIWTRLFLIGWRSVELGLKCCQPN